MKHEGSIRRKIGSFLYITAIIGFQSPHNTALYSPLPVALTRSRNVVAYHMAHRHREWIEEKLLNLPNTALGEEKSRELSVLFVR
jgi:hypothetical protein